MSTATRFGYDYVFELATQLSQEEQERFVQEMSDLRKERVAEPQKIRWIEYTVPGEPIVSAAEIEEIDQRVARREAEKTPEERKKNREKLMELLLNCPVFTDEELKVFEEARREINECRLAYL